MKAGARAVLNGLIDYAGLFPPAGLSMPEAVRNFAAYQRREDAWALGRFVVPVSRLAEFERALELLPESERLGSRWPLSALLGAEPRADLDQVLVFNERHVHAGPEVEALETRAPEAAAIGAMLGIMPAGLELFFELPLSASLPVLMEEVGRAGARAKIRTGGVQPAEIPPPEDVLEFLEVAARARVPFKATAGLHHPVRGAARLTYERASPCATMHGYLNVILAAALLWHGRPVEEARRLLLAEGRENLALGEEGIGWEGVTVALPEIARARREFVLAVGSCSFTEPVEEIESS
jgi:hypothetical protein